MLRQAGPRRYAVVPPSTAKAAPVTKEASSDNTRRQRRVRHLFRLAGAAQPDFANRAGARGPPCRRPASTAGRAGRRTRAASACRSSRDRSHSRGSSRAHNASPWPARTRRRHAHGPRIDRGERRSMVRPRRSTGVNSECAATVAPSRRAPPPAPSQRRLGRDQHGAQVERGWRDRSPSCRCPRLDAASGVADVVPDEIELHRKPSRSR